MNPDVTHQSPVPVEELPQQSPEVKLVDPNQPVPTNTKVEINKQIPGIPQKVPRLMLVLIIFVLAIFLLMITFIIGKLSAPASKQIACTLEAKVCPDGTSVIRTGPNCEFTPCPTPAETPSVTANWKTYTNPLYLIKYPATWTFVNSTKDQQVSIYYQPDLTRPVGSIVISQVSLESLGELTLYNQVKTIGGIEAKCQTETNAKILCYLSLNGEYLSFIITPDKVPSYNATLDEILSTFKFVEPVPTPTPVSVPTASPSSSPSATPVSL